MRVNVLNLTSAFGLSVMGNLSENSPSIEQGKKRKRLRLAHKAGGETDQTGDKLEQEDLEDDEGDLLESNNDVVLEGGLRIPASIYNNLFDYQRTGVKWLWELHCQKAGGIIGDEMGLGKTVQVVSFLAALHYSGLYKPSIVVCPGTLLRQWKRELKVWYPAFKAQILHDSALKVPVKKSKNNENESADEVDGSESEEEENNGRLAVPKAPINRLDRWSAMIESVQSSSGILITTYDQLRINRDKLLAINWGYAVLDEGHKVRNPDAEITLVCKQLQTVHRIIMTGVPIQNSLIELWSLFDFVFPGKLGVLPVFQMQVALPIKIGGYANATPLQVSTAYRCAVVLRDLILPYLLRRMKADVKANLTQKTEHVLFCSLTKEQRTAYREFLGSTEVESIIEGKKNVLFGIDIMRKICNHPDLLDRLHSAGHPDYGNPERSGKLKAVVHILKLWKSQGHRVLLFTQTQQMLDIMQAMAESESYEYRRMDGSTAVSSRMVLIDEFNESESIFLFLLTTKVGGLGTNLTGANRVIIFDPDWNPSTDMQARERCWRIGQQKDVTIYRLITKGTIEEKVYHRQIYKHFLTSKILNDPKQSRIFKDKDLRDLFVLQDDTTETETATLFGANAGDLMILDPKTQGGTGVVPSQIESANSDAEGMDKEGSDKETEEEESVILKNLFDANGIHTAMDHDAILGVSNNEKVTVDQEAGRFANSAAFALRQSRMLRSTDDISVPTWTGRSGEAGAPASVRRRFGSGRNSGLVASPALRTGTVSTVHSQTRTVQQTETHLSTSRPAGLGLGSAAGRALNSHDVLSRMKEHHLGALGPALERAHAGPSGPPDATISNGFQRWSLVGAESRQISLTNRQDSHIPANSSVRNTTAMFPRPTQDCQISTAGRNGLSTSYSSGRSSEALSTQPDMHRKGFGRDSAGTPLRPGQGSQTSPASHGGGRAGVHINGFGRGSANTPLRSGQGLQASSMSLRGGRADVQKNGFGGTSAAPLKLEQGSQSSMPSTTDGRGSELNSFSGGGSQSILREIREFLQQNGGSVSSHVIVSHFKNRFSGKDISVFRHLLREAASLNKEGQVSRWVLKPEPTAGAVLKMHI